jgi:hypothetical protein
VFNERDRHQDTQGLLRQLLEAQQEFANSLARYELQTQARLDGMARELNILTEIVKPNNQEEGSLGYQVKTHHHRLLTIETDVKEIRLMLAKPTWIQLSANRALNTAIQATALGAVGFAGLSLWSTIVHRIEQQITPDPLVQPQGSLDR